MENFLLGLFWFVLGVGASYGVWWLLNHYWIPSVSFSLEMVERKLGCGESFFQCVFKNDGRREIIDLEIIVRIGVYRYKGATGWAYHSVKTNASRVPSLSVGKRRLVKIYDTRESVEYIDQASMSLRGAIENCQSLRQILELGEDAAVRVHVFGYDSFSGTRKHYQSDSYRVRDIRIGRFDDLYAVQDDKNYSGEELSG